MKRFKETINSENWRRKFFSLESLRNGTSEKLRKPLVFQFLDIDYFTQFNSKPAKSIIRIYGVDEEQNSVVLFIHNFLVYFYVKIPRNYVEGGIEEQFTRKINSALKNSLNTERDFKTAIETKKSILGYSFGEKSKFVRVFFDNYSQVSNARKTILKLNENGERLITYESNISHELRFMIDNNISGNCWLEVLNYRLRDYSEKETLCSIELDIFETKNLIAHNELVPKWIKLAKFRILSFDIECAGRKGHFPEAQKDKVIQIANKVTLQGESEPIIDNVFVLGTCGAIAGVDVICFEDEREMLRKWSEFVRDTDPDILTGYNIINFDIPYLVNRAEVLEIGEFGYLGRIRDSRIRMRTSYYSNQAYGRHETKTIYLEGRVIFDLLPIVIKEYKLHSYTLNAVSAHFLSQQKEDVHYSIITELFEGTAETRRRLALYCVKDAALPQKLLDKLMLVVNNVEMSRVTGVPVSYLLTRGQQIKVLSQLHRKARSKGVLVPHRQVSPSEGQFVGATVLEPKIGYYTDPIATLDFTSLYPSIMIAHNLCYTTLLSKSDAEKRLERNDYSITPSGECFVKANLLKGLLPEILTELLDARKKAKEDLKREKDPFVKGVLNGRQLALKISANSVYGFTGASMGALPCISIPSSVTAYGREMIMQTKNKIEMFYVAENGYSSDAKVVYGDTDSVMINFGASSVEKTINLGKEAAIEVTKLFKAPISLEFEKVYHPFLLMAKKRYAGMLWNDPSKPAYIDAKGIETVRRDNCALVRDLVQNCLNKLLIEKNIDGALSFAKRVIKKLLTHKVDLSKLVISKSLGRDAKSYKVKLPHVELAKRMALRDPGSAPMVGDRVAYVIIQGAKGARQYEKAEDPIYVLQKGLSIDAQHYLDHQLKMPLERIFSPIIGDINKIIYGEHTRNVKVSKASKSSSIMRFFSKSAKCKGCKNPLKGKEKAVCGYCSDKKAEIYLKDVLNLRSHERRFSELWVQCQRCQDSLAQEIICSNRDCPIFYSRTKAAKDLDEAREAIREF